MIPVVLIVVDGLRPDALTAGKHPSFDALRASGAVALAATSVLPSISLPCHVSMFHSVAPNDHGITTNVWQPLRREIPSVIDLAAAARLRVAAFYNWEPLRDLSRPGSLAFAYFRDNLRDVSGDQIIAEQAARVIANEQPDFAFVYLGTLDIAGHDHGWMSNAYFEQLRRVDYALGVLLNALPAHFAIILQSDHGGHDHGHGTDAPEDLTIPWIARGQNIRRGYALRAPVSLLDTAPTLARLLGLAPHAEWQGRVIEEIFETA